MRAARMALWWLVASPARAVLRASGPLLHADEDAGNSCRAARRAGVACVLERAHAAWSISRWARIHRLRLARGDLEEERVEAGRGPGGSPLCSWRSGCPGAPGPRVVGAERPSARRGPPGYRVRPSSRAPYSSSTSSAPATRADMPMIATSPRGDGAARGAAQVRLKSAGGASSSAG